MGRSTVIAFAFALALVSAAPATAATGTILYGFPDYVHAGGTMRADIPGGHISGSADGEIAISSGKFNLSVQGEACTLFCYGAAVLVSSEGIVACGKVSVNTLLFGKVTWEPGLGWHYDDPIPTIYLAGCDIGDFKAKVSAAGADGERTFTVPKGTDRAEVRLVDVGGAPSVQVKGPDGETVSTATNALDIGRTLRVFRQHATGRTWIGVDGAKAGEYTITPLPGSARIAEVATANGLPPANVKATDGGSADKRTLRYDVGARPGQQVTFIERGGASEQILGTVKSGDGTLRFAPDDGAPGTRKIVARITVNGLVTEERQVATFTAGKPPKPGKPSSVRVLRKGTSLTVSWGGASNAADYAVVVTPAGGKQKAVQLSGKRRSAKIAGIAATLGGTVSVRALSEAGDAGPLAAVRFRATKKGPSRFRPYSELRAKKR